uniref:G-protein coupled receptors family 1 profile domain-containing protein n=1 Tax=Chinchilla lanigera TaxID=34839 RepID=A0A8C2VH35_CHILA
MRSHTRVTVFILADLTDDPELKVVLFTSLLLTYLLSITGNLTIITLALMDVHLKTPMYFFLLNYSWLEISYTTTCIPKLLSTMAAGDKTISCDGFVTQVFFASLLGTSEFYELAAMSYDRYVAICKPLHYTTITNRKILTQSFLLHSPAGDDGFVSALVTLLVTIVMVIISYAFIALTIFKIPSTSQRKKAFSTCSSHVIVISLSYGSCIFMYVKPSVKQRISISKGIAVLNTSVGPLLNPFIYTLRNQQVKRAF